MAAARKKQDEKNLKTLRELVSLPGNKHCFDCNQRGPTYINMTIGSFICTKCSGMLRGLTPPHRVKSISMASFTTEEIDLVKSKGNDYCRQTWLGLYEQNHASETKDEQQIKDFMIDKYEKKRFYLEPSKALKNGTAPPSFQKVTTFSAPSKQVTVTLPSPASIHTKNNVKPITNGTANTNGRSDFVADFGSADIFTSSQFNNNNTAPQSQQSFANFDNNPIFNASNQPSNNVSANNINNASFPQINKPIAPPSEDRYAALKDLDNALKIQHQQESQLEWSTNSSNGSGYVSPAQSTGSLYGSPSTAGSMYGSPSQAQFASAFPQQEVSNTSNPFSPNTTPNPWSSNGNGTVIANNFNGFSANPFRTDNFNGAAKYNGTSNGYNGNQTSSQQFQQNLFSSSQPAFANNKAWNMPNPFATQLGVAPVNNGFSNNPFL